MQHSDAVKRLHQTIGCLASARLADQPGEMSNQGEKPYKRRCSLIATSEINLHAQCVQGTIRKSTFTLSPRQKKKEGCITDVLV